MSLLRTDCAQLFLVLPECPITYYHFRVIIELMRSSANDMSIRNSLHAVFRVGKPQYDLLRFDFQVGV